MRFWTILKILDFCEKCVLGILKILQNVNFRGPRAPGPGPGGPGLGPWPPRVEAPGAPDPSSGGPGLKLRELRPRLRGPRARAQEASGPGSGGWAWPM